MTALALNGLLLVPALFAALAFLVGRRREELGVAVAVAGGAVTAVWSLGTVALAGRGLDGASVDSAWVSSLDVRWHLGVDGISGPFLLMTTLVLGCALVSLLRRPPPGGSAASLAALLLLIEAGVLGSFLALDLVVFFGLFEVALIPMWFVIDQWGDAAGRGGEAGRRQAATRFLVFTVLGSALMLVGFLLVRSDAGTFDVVELASTYQPTGPTAVTAAVLVALGLMVKAPVWPLHLWLPDAHSRAPTVGSVVLAAVLLKLGTYGLIRFWLPVTDPGWALVPVVAALATVGIVYAALACLAQTDLKRLIAYSSVGHMGFVVLAVATFTVGGVQAAVFASVAHGLITGLLFFVAGAVKERYGTGDLAELRALYGGVPRLAGVLAFAAMASLGLPGLAGFWGEVLAVRAALYPASALPGGMYVALAVLASLGVVLTAAYFLALLRTVAQGEAVPEEDAALEQGPPREDARPLDWVAWSPLMVLTVVLGVAPGLLLSPVAEATTAFLDRL